MNLQTVLKGQKIKLIFSLCLIFTITLCSLFKIQAKETNLNTEPMQILKEMTEYIGSAKQFSFYISVADEVLLSPKEKRRVNRKVNLYVKRPNKLKAEVTEKATQMSFWFDGKQITLFNEHKALYATVDAPETIDEALDFAMEQLELSAPFVDFVLSNPFENFTANVIESKYIGKTEYDGRKCHHLLFKQKSIDWEIWIEDGKKPLPKKLVITYKLLPLKPQFTASFDKFRVGKRISDKHFGFKPPKESDQIEFLFAKTQNEEKDDE